MKRFLLLIAAAALVLLVPTEAAAKCGFMCVSVFGPCTETSSLTGCIDLGNCQESPCLFGGRGNPDRSGLLTSKYQIASVEIEYRNPADTRENEIRVARKTSPEPVKKTSLE